eukprot:jgi/Orpsp1_1/1184949/evm.model.c7180000091695.1
MTLNGTISFNDGCVLKKCKEKDIIQIKNFDFHALNNYDGGIKLYGNVNIYNSIFYGGGLNFGNLMSYNGEYLNSINIFNSYFDGVYSNNCLEIINSNNSNINLSIFEKCGSYIKEGGGAIRVIYSDVVVKDCIYKDNFSYQNGGIFYVYESYSFNAQNITAYNTTVAEK